MAKFKHKEECFVLITNVENHECDMRQILEYYKDQMVVETEFRLLKEPCIASVIYLKTSERIRALMMFLSISLLIRALVQYKMRKGIKEYKDDLPKGGWNGAKIQHNLTMKFLTVALYGQYFTR